MACIETLEELNLVREEIANSHRERCETGTVIYVGMGTCGIAAGAKETMQAIEAEVAKRQLDISVEPVGCLGICVKEPLVDICQAGKSHIIYAGVHPEMVSKLIEEHLGKGRPVQEWVLGRMSA